jgi:putative transcriptional regulator
MSKAGKRLIQAAKEAAAIARGELAPARVFVPADIDVKSIRRKLKLQQDGFASQFGFTINQIRD